ncbi:MAG: AAA+ family ATPase, partial [Candidatus Methylomirabilales bacterium]
EEMLLVQLGGPRLRHELDRVPLWRGDHVGIKQLAEDFATYLYLPRLCDDSVLSDAVRDGLSRLTWQSETFAYADHWDEQKKKYVGLQTGPGVRVTLDERSFLVKPDVAISQIQADKERQVDVQPQPPGEGGAVPTIQEQGEATPPPPVATAPRRFHATVVLDATRIGRDASRIAEEVVQHLTRLVGSNVEVTLEIRADVPDGVPDQTVRIVTENCRALKFKTHGFEKE